MTYAEARQEIDKITDIEMSEINELFRDMPVNLAPHLVQLALAEVEKEKEESDPEKQKGLLKTIMNVRGNVLKEIEKKNNVDK